MSGYIYRMPHADPVTLRETVREVVGFPCWSFGGAAAWDFDPSKGRANLRPVALVHTSDALVVTGDFGHAFTEVAEVRWQRREQAAYDILILSDPPLTLPNAPPFGSANGAWTTSMPANPKRVAIIQSGERPVINFITYHAPNGAAQFLSYRLEVPL